MFISNNINELLLIFSKKNKNTFNNPNNQTVEMAIILDKNNYYFS